MVLGEQIEGYELDDPCSGRRDNTECMHMRHDIVSPLLFFLGSDLKLLPVQTLRKIPGAKRECVRSPAFIREGDWKRVTNEVVFHLFDGLIRDRKSKLLLRDGEVEPEFSPSMVSVLFKETAKSVFPLLSSVSR